MSIVPYEKPKDRPEGLRKIGSANFVMLQTVLLSSSDCFGDVAVMGSIIMDKADLNGGGAHFGAGGHE